MRLLSVEEEMRSDPRRMSCTRGAENVVSEYTQMAGRKRTHSSADNYCVFVRLDANARSKNLDVRKVLLRCLLVLESSFQEWSDRVVGSPDVVERSLWSVRSDL